MKELIREYGKTIISVVVITLCICMMTGGLLINHDVGEAAQIQEDNLTANRVGPELTSIAKVPEDFGMTCRTGVMVDDRVPVNALFTATEGGNKIYPVSITGIKDASGRDALVNGTAELSGGQVTLHAPGMYRFYIRVMPLQVTKCFEVFCEEKE